MSYKKTTLEVCEVETINNCLKVVAPNLIKNISHDAENACFIVNNEYVDYLELIYSILIHKTALTVTGNMGIVTNYKEQNKIINGFMYMMYCQMVADISKNKLLEEIDFAKSKQIPFSWVHYSIDYCAKRINEWQHATK